jgi:hypothetical protein
MLSGPSVPTIVGFVPQMLPGVCANAASIIVTGISHTVDSNNAAVATPRTRGIFGFDDDRQFNLFWQIAIPSMGYEG